jgi:hypothetical protein
VRPARIISQCLAPLGRAKATLVLEAEHEIRTLEKDLRELQVLDEQNVIDSLSCSCSVGRAAGQDY